MMTLILTNMYTLQPFQHFKTIKLKEEENRERIIQLLDAITVSVIIFSTPYIFLV
jgi:hypothetical protein